MKVLLFSDGQDGVINHLPGEHPWPELCDLLGGDVDTTPINEHLALVSRRDMESLDLPQHYLPDLWPGRPIYGDCAVIAVREDGALKDINTFSIMQPAIAILVPCMQKTEKGSNNEKKA